MHVLHQVSTSRRRVCVMKLISLRITLQRSMAWLEATAFKAMWRLSSVSQACAKTYITLTSSMARAQVKIHLRQIQMVRVGELVKPTLTEIST